MTDCMLSGLSTRKAQTALANLNKAQAKTVAKAIKDALASNPGGEVDAVISSARASV